MLLLLLLNYSFSLFYGLLSGLGPLLRMFSFLWLSQLGVINYIKTEILWAHNFNWVQWKADSLYFLCKKMFKMFTVGEMATNFLHANAGNCNSTMLSVVDFASVCKTSAVSLNLQYRSKVSWQSLASRSLRRETRFSVLETFEDRVSRLEDRVSSLDDRGSRIEF